MEVGVVKAPELNAGIPAQRAGMPNEAKPVVETAATGVLRPDDIKVKETADAKDAKNQDEEAVPQTVEAVNQFLDLMNADLKFALHQKTNRIMVQLVSEKDQKVLREYPSKEFLDMIARIRDFVGIFMDKKA